MKLLAFDTSTEAISIAVTREQSGKANVWQHQGKGGAQASQDLIAAINRLMAQAGLNYEELDAIVFGQGPGSFTGLRTACSVAQGLAFGTSAHPARSSPVPVLPIDTLLALAEEARWQFAPESSALQVAALLDARMDQLYVGNYQYNSGLWQALNPCALCSPEALVHEPACAKANAWAGNVFDAYGPRLQAPEPMALWQALPTAAAMLRLAPAQLAAGRAVPAEAAWPVYIRDKVAKTTQERAAEKAVHPLP